MQRRARHNVFSLGLVPPLDSNDTAGVREMIPGTILKLASINTLGFRCILLNKIGRTETGHDRKRMLVADSLPRARNLKEVP
jgi:hypothetical protein